MSYLNELSHVRENSEDLIQNNNNFELFVVPSSTCSGAINYLPSNCDRALYQHLNLKINLSFHEINSSYKGNYIP